MSTNGTTVFGGGRSSIDERDNLKLLVDRDEGNSPRKPTQLLAKGKQKATFDGPFMTDVEYMSEYRSFFIKIEKDGVLPALHKLDEQLQKVRSFSTVWQPLNQLL